MFVITKHREDGAAAKRQQLLSASEHFSQIRTLHLPVHFLLYAKVHPHQCHVPRLQGEKPQNHPDLVKYWRMHFVQLSSVWIIS